MAYSGYLIKVGDFAIDPAKHISADSYSVLYSTSDLDSTRNANGELIRTALEHKVGKIEFNTRNMMTNFEMSEFMANIRQNYTIANEKAANVTFYVPELDKYITQKMYMPDITYKINRIDENNVIYYEATRMAFIAY